MKRLLAAVAMVGAVLLGQVAPAAAATTGHQSFTVIINDDDARVIGSGPISGFGQFIEDPNNEDIISFAFPEGTITLNAPNDEESDSFNEFACVGTFRFSGHYTITGATEAYAGATGTGTFSGRGIFVGERTDEGCSEEGGHFFLIATTSGTTTLP